MDEYSQAYQMSIDVVHAGQYRVADEDVEDIDGDEYESFKIFIWKTFDNDSDAMMHITAMTLRKRFGIRRLGTFEIFTQLVHHLLEFNLLSSYSFLEV